MAVIYPTHKCFDDVMEFIADRIKENTEEARALLVVHGICKANEGPHAGELYAHGWVEEPALGVCWEAGFLNGQKLWYSIERNDYYEVRSVQQSTRYTLEQCWEENVKARHYGPWRPEYLALCGKSKRVMGAFQALPPTTT